MPEPLAPPHPPTPVRAPVRTRRDNPPVVPDLDPSVEPGVEPDTDEQAFWARRFDDPPRPTVADDTPPTRRERRTALPRPEVGERLADRMRDLLADTRAGVVALVVVAVVAGFVWYRMGAGGASHGVAPATSSARSTTLTTAPRASAASSSSSSASAVSAAAKPATARIVVHVAGAVTKPGVVELPAGSRVIDAVEAVGGALPDGDLDRLNLAAKVSDGQRIYVAKPGAADPGAAVDGADPATGAPTPGGKLNLNTATQAQLEALPGLGPSFAQAILAERQRRGSFTSVNDLRSVRGIGDKRFADLAPLVTV